MSKVKYQTHITFLILVKCSNNVTSYNVNNIKYLIKKHITILLILILIFQNYFS